jgi:hypothetical protein
MRSTAISDPKRFSMSLSSTAWLFVTVLAPFVKYAAGEAGRSPRLPRPV